MTTSCRRGYSQELRETASSSQRVTRLVAAYRGLRHRGTRPTEVVSIGTRASLPPSLCLQSGALPVVGTARAVVEAVRRGPSSWGVAAGGLGGRDRDRRR